ncbi:hypothetical protein AAVH_19566 [Aphelenchoides avenae]|nr:hypothetical protein AAVH_19566 [Aphelenchus avenae]
MHVTTLLGLIFLTGMAIAERPPLKCGPHERLEICTACPQPSCRHPDIPNKPCRLLCANEGCVCAEGYYRDDRDHGKKGKCITQVECTER